LLISVPPIAWVFFREIFGLHGVVSGNSPAPAYGVCFWEVGERLAQGVAGPIHTVSAEELRASWSGNKKPAEAGCGYTGLPNYARKNLKMRGPS
jgi:hypothetical protein